MRDITYCANPNCPFKDCARSAEQLKNQHNTKLANLGGLCRRYGKWLAEKKDGNKSE